MICDRLLLCGGKCMLGGRLNLLRSEEELDCISFGQGQNSSPADHTLHVHTYGLPTTAAATATATTPYCLVVVVCSSSSTTRAVVIVVGAL